MKRCCRNLLTTTRALPSPARRLSPLIVCLVSSFCLFVNGCAAITNPIANGIPVQRLPEELRGESKENLEAVPLSLLGQPPPKAYRLAAEDVLGIWIEGVLGEKDKPPPVLQQQVEKNIPPALGFPIPVDQDGTINLPAAPPIKVEGMTLVEAKEAIRKTYIANEVLKPGKEKLAVTLQRPRRYHVLVIRQDSSAGGTGPPTPYAGAGFMLQLGAGATGTRHGKGFAIDLPAYENDVLNALAQTGGFPGSDAINEIIVERGGARDNDSTEDRAARNLIRIPLRVRKGEKPNIRQEDVILHSGDAVYIEAREQGVYYTGGLLPPGSWPLPRDTDLDVLEAVLQARAAVNSGGLSALNIQGTTIGTPLGNPSPSLVAVLRHTANGKQVVIRVDLNIALRDPRERLLIQPRDVLLMQETPQQALARYFSHQFQTSTLWIPSLSRHFTQSDTFVAP